MNPGNWPSWVVTTETGKILADLTNVPDDEELFLKLGDLGLPLRVTEPEQQLELESAVKDWQSAQILCTELFAFPLYTPTLFLCQHFGEDETNWGPAAAPLLCSSWTIYTRYVELLMYARLYPSLLPISQDAAEQIYDNLAEFLAEHHQRFMKAVGDNFVGQVREKLEQSSLEFDDLPRKTAYWLYHYVCNTLRSMESAIVQLYNLSSKNWLRKHQLSAELPTTSTAGFEECFAICCAQNEKISEQRYFIHRQKPLDTPLTDSLIEEFHRMPEDRDFALDLKHPRLLLMMFAENYQTIQ